MKKLYLWLCLVLFSLVAKAAGQYDTKEEVIDRAKAIAARHVIHNKGGEFIETDKALNAKNVDALKKLIKTDPGHKFKQICDEIEEFDVKAKDTTSLINSFKYLLFEKYKVKDKGALEQVKAPIKNKSSLFFNEETNTTSNDEEDDEDTVNEESSSVVSSSPSKGSGSSGIIKDEKSTIKENGRHDRSEGISLILPLAVLIIALLGSLFFCFQLWRKNKVLEEEKNKTIKELSPIAPAYARKSIHELARAISKKYNDMAHDLEAMKRDQNGLKERIEILEEKNRSSQNSVLDDRSRYNDVKSYETENEDSGSPTISWDIEKENAERLHHDPEVIPEVVSVVGKEMFLYLPNDNMFKEGTEEYRSGKTLYKMTYTSDETADFEFVNRPEALAFAKQSRSRFLESACVIENDDAISFNTIQTLEKGKLTKADEGWNIISKARIRLS